MIVSAEQRGNKMSRLFTIAPVIAVLLWSSTASAGVYADDLAKCLVKSSSADDQAVLVQWTFASLTLNPALTKFSSVTAEQRDGFNRQVAAIFQRLLYTDCHNETLDALKYEGTTTLQSSFGVLGQVAFRGMMSDPNTAKGLAGFGTYLDKAKLVELFKSAGVPVAPSQTAPATK